MTRTADNQAWAILARHRYAEETARVMHYLILQATLCGTYATPEWAAGLSSMFNEEAA